MVVKISRDLVTVTSCIDVSVRIETKSPKGRASTEFSISLGKSIKYSKKRGTLHRDRVRGGGWSGFG
jgi:hypothetical protein